MKHMGSLLWVKRLLWTLLACILMSTAMAADKDPYAIVGDVTDALVGAARDFKADNDQAAFDKKVLMALEPVVAFDYIARVVMGDYYKGATKEQQERFAALFKANLVSTYAKGIATYADSNIKVMPAPAPVGDERRVTVDQEVSHEGETHKLSYSMAKNKTGEWKLINLVLNGINLGRSFSSQFEQLAGKNGGDIDKVIASWEAGEG